MKTDTLSETLMRMKLKAGVSKALDAGGKWAIEFPQYEGVKLHVVLKGDCWLSIEGEQNRHHFNAGDCFLLSGGKPFVVAKDLSVRKRLRAEAVMRAAQSEVATVNGGGDFFEIGALFQFEGHLPALLFSGLPAVLHIPENSDQAAVLRWSLERFISEFREQKPGQALILNHLAPIMLVQVLRIYSNSGDRNSTGWFVALADPKLSRAIESIHTNYQHNLSLEGLAKVAGMSRSGFALNFKKLVGTSPMDYLTHWRMQIACELLQSSSKSISAVANTVGYESESAFSVAFNKVVKCRPGIYQKSHRTLAHPTHGMARVDGVPPVLNAPPEPPARNDRAAFE